MSVTFDLTKLDKEKQKEIDKLLTFKPVNKMKKHLGYQPVELPVKMYFTKDKKVNIPYTFACEYFKKRFHLDKDYEKINENPNGMFLGKLLDRQKEPFKKAIQYLKSCNTVTIALYPGFGKTFMGVMLSWYLNKKTCVLVHRDNVGKQWVKSFKAYFKDLKEEDIWFVDDKPRKDCKIIISMDGRTDKIPQELREKIGTLIIDEAHCFCSTSKVKPLLHFQPKYIIAETATPTKDNGMERMIQSICGTHYIQKISEKPYHFFIIQTNLEYEIKEGKNIFHELIQCQTSSEKRNDLIIEILKANTKYKTMIAGNRKEHCSYIHKRLKEEDLESSELYGTIKNYKTKNILIGTGSKMGVGFDEANFCDDYDGRPSDLLIMLYTFATWSPFEQVRGRVMRCDNPKVVVLNDKSPVTKKHMTKMRKWVRESNGKIIELKLDKMESFNLDEYI